MRERPTLSEAAAAFLDQPDLASSSRRSYAQTLGRLQAALGEDRPLDRIGVRELERVAWDAWGQTAPATWNRHAATLRSFAGFNARHGWADAELAAGLERRREPADRTRAIPYAQLERLWRRDDVAIREKALRGCCMRPRRGRRRCSRSTSTISTWITAGRGFAPKAETPTGCTCRPAPRGCSRGWWPAAPAARCFCRTGGPRRPGRRRRRICALTPAGRGCPTAAPRSFSAQRRAGGRCISCATPRSPTWPRPTSPCRC